MKKTGHSSLKRELGIPGATMLGLGSMVGTGVFVSIGIAVGVTGPAVILAITLAAVVATCNALSSAQLTANHPVAGGTYEYGYKWVNSYFGFTAGFMFLLAKGATAATAALGFSSYLLFNLGGGREDWLVPMALAVVLTLTLIVATGIRHSSRFNIAVVYLRPWFTAFLYRRRTPANLGRELHSFLPVSCRIARFDAGHAAQCHSVDVCRLHRVRPDRHARGRGSPSAPDHSTRYCYHAGRNGGALHLCGRGRRRKRWHNHLLWRDRATGRPS